MKKSDVVFLVLSSVFVSLAVYRFIFHGPEVLFKSIDEYTNIYGVSALSFLLFFFVVEGGLSTKSSKLTKAICEIFWRLVDFVGFKEVNWKRQILIGLMAGLILPTYILLSSGKSFGFNIDYSLEVIKVMTWDVFNRVLVAPVSEEVFLRGVYINRFVSIFRKKTTSGFIALFSSALIFSGIHTPEHDLINMFIGGLVFSLAYMINWNNLREPFRWKKNIIVAIIAHSISNFIITVVLFTR